MMRKVIMLNRVSLDGYFAGPNGEIEARDFNSGNVLLHYRIDKRSL